MVAAVVLLIAVHLLPEWLASAGLGTQAALEHIAYGIESAALWSCICAACHWLRSGGASRIVGLSPQAMASLVQSAAFLVYASAWGALEGLERAGCRAALPLDRPTALRPGETICDAAVGWPVSLLSLVAALLLAAHLNRRGERR